MPDVNDLMEEGFDSQLQIGHPVVASWPHVVEQNVMVMGTQDRRTLVSLTDRNQREEEQKKHGS